MAGAKTANKNSRAGSTKAARPTNYGEQKFLLPCNGGHNAYVFNPATGQNPNLRTASPEFAAAIAALVEAGYGEKIKAELASLSHLAPVPALTAKLAADGILAA